jgi:hypothetical protein
MTKKTDLIIKLKSEYPTIRVGCDEDGYTELIGADYDAKINEWADNLLEAEAEKAAKQATADAKAALLAKLGINAEEAALLLS